MKTSLSKKLTKISNKEISRIKRSKEECFFLEKEKEKEEFQRGKEFVNKNIHRLEEEASKGKKCCEIYKMKYSDYDGRFPYNKLSLDQIKNPFCKGIYNELNNLGLNPTFNFGHDGVGIKSWFIITANWE